MVVVHSLMPALGTKASDFSLSDLDGRVVSLKDYEKKPLLILFICNHCPYVLHIASKLSFLEDSAKKNGISCVAINSNNIIERPEDSPEKMGLFAKKYKFEFPYLFDSTQEVAKAFRAECTPDFFLYDKSHNLYYRGQMDSSRPGSKEEVTGKDLLDAFSSLSKGESPPKNQKPSIGCNIKWFPQKTC